MAERPRGGCTASRWRPACTTARWRRDRPAGSRRRRSRRTDRVISARISSSSFEASCDVAVPRTGSMAACNRWLSTLDSRRSTNWWGRRSRRDLSNHPMGHRQRGEAGVPDHRRSARLRSSGPGSTTRTRSALMPVSCSDAWRWVCSPPTTSRRSSRSTPTASATARSARRCEDRGAARRHLPAARVGQERRLERGGDPRLLRPGLAALGRRQEHQARLRAHRAGQVAFFHVGINPGFAHGLLADDARGSAVGSTSSPSPRSST